MSNAVRIKEVCPRDGFQNVKTLIKTEDKIAIAKKLMDAGFTCMEMTSFVSPKWIPQMADAAAVVKACREYQREKGYEFVFEVLAPNPKGVDNAAKCDIDAIEVPISVSERHNNENVNRTREQSLSEFAECVKKYDNIEFTLGLATCFGTPYAGDKIEADEVIKMAVKGFELGASRVTLSDTVGNGNPFFVEEVMKRIGKYVDIDKCNFHLHDTFGFAVANTLIGLEYGITSFDSAAGGLGGCPFAPGAAGNMATEDLLTLFNTCGVETEVKYNKSALYEAVGLIDEKVESNIISHAYQFFKCNNAFMAEKQ